ncbi:VOC family protein [Pedobacter mucosus]|uniref:VOC family protein n=1 Tax=Pedobacter mucosus TaxID=2895286 RepID=UPI001EE40F49|nr:VOC family protein [Pedobacter mucosus]UKT64479.1 VOC family protein [Pedobacter mucosus]
MKTRKIWANLVVSNLERTSEFYTALGFKPNNPNTSKDLTSFFVGDENFVIHFFKDNFKAGFDGKIASLDQGNEIVFSLSAESKAEVDEWVLAVKNAGGTVTTEPQNFEKGYLFGFSDPDGHKFNVLYWPG